MAATQMNIRMDAALKESGNAALARLGYTPSQAVRALWEVIRGFGSLCDKGLA
ncbi:addiction module antitoxin%2C RelB/DinJ family [uncultured Collinsella sp.]|nr:addiction module antitoxin%2C RelB/DinJ family [uncultured Collinsella sp.]